MKALFLFLILFVCAVENSVGGLGEKEEDLPKNSSIPTVQQEDISAIAPTAIPKRTKKRVRFTFPGWPPQQQKRIKKGRLVKPKIPPHPLGHYGDLVPEELLIDPIKDNQRKIYTRGTTIYDITTSDRIASHSKSSEKENSQTVYYPPDNSTQPSSTQDKVTSRVIASNPSSSQRLIKTVSSLCLSNTQYWPAIPQNKNGNATVGQTQSHKINQQDDKQLPLPTSEDMGE